MIVLIICIAAAAVSGVWAALLLLWQPHVGRFCDELAISLLWTGSVVGYALSLLGIAETQRSWTEQMSDPAAASDPLFGQIAHTASMFGAAALLFCAFAALRQAGGGISESVNFCAPAIALLSATVVMGVLSDESSRTNAALVLGAVSLAAVAVPSIPVVRSIWHRSVRMSGAAVAEDDTEDPVVITERR